MKTILLLAGLLLSVGISAQTYYYNSTKTFNENGYTYQCDVPGSKMVTLYNKSNQLTYVNMVNKTTGNVYSSIINHDPDTYNFETGFRLKRDAIINNAFTTTEKQRLKGYKLSITLYISPSTGKVMEVCFDFVTTNPYATIPVSVYRNIEVQLKNQIWFIPIAAEASKYNYLFYNWQQEVK